METFEFYTTRDKITRLIKELCVKFKLTPRKAESGLITGACDENDVVVVEVNDKDAVLCHASPGSGSGRALRVRCTIRLDSVFKCAIEKDGYQLRVKYTGSSVAIRVIPANKIHLCGRSSSNEV